MSIHVDGFDLSVRGGAPEARAVADAYLGGSWELLPGIADAAQFDVLAPGNAPDPGEAWELAYRMSQDERVAHAEPLVVTPGFDEPVAVENAGPQRNWQIEHCGIDRAWMLSRGDGIVIAHPDTGYMRHGQIWSDDATRNRILHDLGYDFLRNDPDARVPIGGSTHGTAIASVIMSGSEDAEGVHGVAPGAKLIPLRVDDDVIHWRWGRARRAIEWATAKNAHLISMSLGGPIDGESLHQAVQRAVARGIIVVAAAGNVWPFVVYPAKYAEVMAVAATNHKRRKWGDSARGPEVDVCAPGEDVHRATYDRNGSEVIEHSSGTSYATAVVSGIAALWLSHHGYETLHTRYGAKLPAVFRDVVMKHGVTPDSEWDTGMLGAGIIDAERVLRAPLPEPEVVAPPAAPRDRLTEFANYFPETSPAVVHNGLMRLLRTTDAQLDSDLQVYGNELKLHLAVNEELRERVSGVETRKLMRVPAPAMSRSLAAKIG
jgi:subtilisin family serine protease